MITSRSPLRLSLGGGGTDLPSFYEKYGGYLIAGSINKYVFTTVIKPFTKGIFLKYSKIEKREKISQVNHKIIKSILKNELNASPQIEIITIADIPSGTGLGSSGSFSVGLLYALKSFQNKIINKAEIAAEAAKIEIDQLKLPVGKQDQYIATYGGISEFYFSRDGTVKVKRLNLKQNMIDELNDNMVMFFTGFSRKSSKVLKDQKKKTLQLNKDMINNLKYTKELGFKSKDALIESNLEKYGKIMHEHWMHKVQRTKSMSNKKINKWYKDAIENGAFGGKLVGAGGGGFLLFATENKNKLKEKMFENGLTETKFNFEFEGAKIINNL